MTAKEMDRLEQCLWPVNSRHGAWMIVDCARDHQIYGLLLENFYSDHSCLFSGPLSPALQFSAPYLVQLEHDDNKTRSFISRAWGNSWGIFLRADLSMQTVRRHLRSLLMVRDPGGRRLLFRYYDPRVLRIYLPCCNVDELQRFFGPIEYFCVETEKPRTMVEYGLHSGKLLSTWVPLEPGEGDTAHPLTRRTHAHDPFDPSRFRMGQIAIRRGLISAFSNSEVQKFEDWMVSHLQKFFPARCARLGEGTLRETIQYGIERAAAYGIAAKRDVCKYIDVMIAIGRDFDHDNRFHWAAEILNRAERRGSRAQNLLDSATGYLKSRASSVAGARNV